ncbi:MAG: hypothetical protein JWL77_5921 [Chthonomonadaceae bacterium]|nr:hypothetical protein [Chthonomonadaceae bacterium]
MYCFGRFRRNRASAFPFLNSPLGYHQPLVSEGVRPVPEASVAGKRDTIASPRFEVDRSFDRATGLRVPATNGIADSSDAAMIAQSPPKRKHGIPPETKDFLQCLLALKYTAVRREEAQKRTGPSSDGPVLMEMPKRGVEPPSPCEHWHLKPACLPFHHLGEPNGITGLTLRAFLPNYTGCGTILSRSERTYF